MGLIKRIEQTNNLYQTWVEVGASHCEILWLDHEMTETEAQTFVDAYIEAHLYDETPHQRLVIYDAKEAIEAAVVFIKTTASLTLTKWNNYLATLPFSDKYAVQWFIMAMANRLAEMGDFDISGFTEIQILARMKNWLINTPARRIKKIFYGE